MVNSLSMSTSTLVTTTTMINNNENMTISHVASVADEKFDVLQQENDYLIQNIIYSILYSTVSLAAIGGNSIVIYLIINFRRNRRSVTDMFILNLAIGDLLMAILCIPFTFTANLLFHAWPFGSLMCRLVSYAQAVCVFISAYTLVAISIDRYIAIIYPLRPRMTKRHSQYLVAFIWLVALLTPLPTALLSRLMLQQQPITTETSSNIIDIIDLENNQTNLSYSSLSIMNQTFESDNYRQQQQQQHVLNNNSFTELISQTPDLPHISAKMLKHSEIVKLKNLSSLSNDNSSISSSSSSWMSMEPETSFFINDLTGYDSDNNAFICQEDWNNNHEYRTSYSVLLMILQYILPFTVLVFTYTRIGLMIWGRQTPGERDGGRDARIAASKRKMVKMMITCVVAFTLCWLPLNIFIIIGDHYPNIYQYDHIEYIWVACHWLAMSHASYNPFIYIWMNQRFRNGFRFVLQRCFCCTNSLHSSSLSGGTGGGGGGGGGVGVITSHTIHNNHNRNRIDGDLATTIGCGGDVDDHHITECNQQQQQKQLLMLI
nr:RYamide receptor-like [Dermatophagoides farinae]